ncbi:uncharacterized protein A1O9_09393 [Exophiala aquamarina CBS 119918]|uniref:3-oxoacyl-[acyl-carrier protein] reductase n=1 Tax=Exophiala aquamarina CBS 119918 TaxID=1182545 RepID=A0A072P3E7_9EURO|nr:uncharacterized protein A1O9_09393 [Exophiala aquamarina CBS 119918]KEF54227.1 hypothetical protein A1O9_09393 [Exophiala aquamarina CBS 119918]
MARKNGENSEFDSYDYIPITEYEKQAMSERPSRTLQSKVAIVTGAGALGYSIGNGRATAIMLAEIGANEASAKRTVQIIEYLQLPGRAVVGVADITKLDDCEAVVQLAKTEFGRLDVLVNNVGIHGAKGNSVDVDMTQWAIAAQINVTSMISMAKFAIPVMLEKQRDTDTRELGSIINVASVNGIRGGSPDIIHPTTKGAIVNMTRAMSTHHGSSGIQVNCVCPGAVYTPMVGGIEGVMSDIIRESRKKRSILGTEGSGWDVGAAIRFLASSEASWITGVILPVDAGATAAVGVGHNMGH